MKDFDKEWFSKFLSYGYVFLTVLAILLIVELTAFMLYDNWKTYIGYKTTIEKVEIAETSINKKPSDKLLHKCNHVNTLAEQIAYLKIKNTPLAFFIQPPITTESLYIAKKAYSKFSLMTEEDVPAFQNEMVLDCLNGEIGE